MITSLKEIVIPVLKNKGFSGSIPHLRRIGKDRINLLTFQFDRHGGGFVIEIANCKPTGFKTSSGNKTDVHKLTAHDFFKRKRIQSNMDMGDSLTEDWFRYDRKYLFGFGNIYKKVCEDVLSKLDVAEDYWENGEFNE